MNRQQFFQWMHNPQALNTESVKDLQELIREYPFFQTARILNLMNLKLLKDFRFEQELRGVAALSADRARLREWLLQLEEMPVEESRKLKSELPEPPSAPDPDKDIQLKNLEEQIKASLKEIELKKSRLRELMEEKKAIAGDYDQKTEDLQ
ncbi:MAG: hypothetical protein HGA23_02110, partial [Bacteroidales bacterium]|nr:hypothetical protein [Bacteroidales bacterium]